MGADSNLKRTVMYLSYGEIQHQLGVIFSLITAFRFLPPGNLRYRYVVYTDQPKLFENYGVEIQRISDVELNAWLDHTNYIHRRKTKAIIDALERFNGPLAFVDSDTYFKRSPELLFDRIGRGKTLFHTKEARLFEADSLENAKLISSFRTSQVFDANGEVIPFSERDEMWNSGVLGLSPCDLPALRKALPIMDQLWKNSGSAPVEQFAVSYVLSHTLRMQCRDVVFHYWSDSIRRDFERKLPELLLRLNELPANDRPQVAYRFRPRWPLRTILRSRIRELARKIGLPTRGVVKSV